VEWTCKGFGKEIIRPDWLYTSKNQPVLPVFIDSASSRRLGVGLGRNVYAKILRWLRHRKLNLALLTNGGQWRVVYAGMDHDAYAEWETDQWFANGEATAELGGFLSLLQPEHWLGKPSKLLLAVQASRKGQNDLSGVMGERVRNTVEMLIREHGAALGEKLPDVSSKEIYMAGVRMVMRLVVAFFAESREGLLPKSNAIYSQNYSLASLMHELKRHRGNRSAMSERHHAWPRLLALLRLIHTGSGHEAMPVPAYGGQLFVPGQWDAPDAISRVIALFENEYRSRSLMSDLVVAEMLEMLAENRVRIRQGHAFTTVPMPIDFSSLGNEYIGILFESLLNFELKYAEADNPIVFLNIGDQPALPLPALEQMSDAEIAGLFKTLKKQAAQAKKADAGGDSEDDADGDDAADKDAADEEDASAVEDDVAEEAAAVEDVDAEIIDDGAAVRQRAQSWAARAATLVGLVRVPKTVTQDSALRYEQDLQREARRLLFKVVEPGEWYLVRWGGTRKGSGTFYTKPQLAIPTVMRTLRPLAFTQNGDGDWLPKKPRDIISIKVCDPACGSGSFLLAALRFLTDALYDSIQFHHCLDDWTGQSLDAIIWADDAPENLSAQQLPCRPDAEDFEPRLKALLRRYVVERCIYGVDLDPVAAELCRLALWIETLDRELPMTFLDHKIKCGNSLVGAWSDQFMHYPLAAWRREGGDKGHKNGVHHASDAWTTDIKALLNQAKTQITDILDGAFSFMQPLDYERAMSELRQNLKSMDLLHSININDIAERTRQYAAMRQSPEFIALKDAFDLWCAIWFWPGKYLDRAPLPNAFALERLDPDTLEIIRNTAAQNRFFHWELEFPDVFNDKTFGFDAILGNPPWDIAKPKSQEFFSMHDPLY
ncbi:MAG: SAM-dependent DNA methyltransferase, partial [Lentisphaerae bacterium]|nr:SAM-dependent DNA methyltransferase [Lentisphaerota bacterium]